VTLDVTRPAFAAATAEPVIGCSRSTPRRAIPHALRACASVARVRALHGGVRYVADPSGGTCALDFDFSAVSGCWLNGGIDASLQRADGAAGPPIAVSGYFRTSFNPR